MALIALIQAGELAAPRGKVALVALGMFGASLFYGDGMITPAISVLSAVEGLEVVAPGLRARGRADHARRSSPSCSAIQRFGTGAVGRAVRAGDGRLVRRPRRRRPRPQVVEHPAILKALSPTLRGRVLRSTTSASRSSRSARSCSRSPAPRRSTPTWATSAGPPIRRAWFFVVFPALTLNYMGQGALILDDPTAIDNPFFLLMPDWARMPDGGAGDGGDGDRLAGGDLRRLLGHPPGGPARLPAAAARSATPPTRDRPGLRAGRQLVAVRRGRRAGGRLRLLASSSPPPTASRSPARSRSTRSCSSSSSRVAVAQAAAGWWSPAPPCS